MSTQTHRTGRLKTALTISFLFVSHVLPLTEPEIKTIIRDQVTSFFNALTGAQRDSIPYNTFRRQCFLKLHPDKPISHPTTGRDLTPEEKTETAQFFNGVFPDVLDDDTFSKNRFFKSFFVHCGNYGLLSQTSWEDPSTGKRYTFPSDNHIKDTHFPAPMIMQMIKGAHKPNSGTPGLWGNTTPDPWQNKPNGPDPDYEEAIAKRALRTSINVTIVALGITALAAAGFYFTSRSKKAAQAALLRLVEDVVDNNNVSLLDRLNAVRIRNINSYKSVDGTNKKRASIDVAYKNLVRTPRMKKIANDFGFSEADMLAILPLYLAYRDAGGRQALARNILIGSGVATALTGGYSYYRHRAHTIARNAIPVPQPPAGAPIPAPVPAPAPAPNPIHIPSAFGCPNVVLPNGQTIPDVD